MTLISIRERGLTTGQPAVAIDDQEFPLTNGLKDPFSAEEEERLEWYFEKHMRFPFVQQVKAREAAQSVTTYGHKLFEQLFADRRAYSRYQSALQQGVETLSLEVVGSPEFHRFHWEALKDPDLPLPLALQAPMVRRNLQPRKIEAHPRPSPTLNLLVVTARPGVERDVGYRTISRPLVESLRQANLRVSIDILRPGTYEALDKHLRATRDRHGAGYYHVIHFDVHGLVMSYKELQRGFQPSSHSYQARYGRQDITPYEGSRAYLFLEGEKDEQADPVEADELAKLLTTHQIPIAILNACQSGKQVGGTETSLGSRLMQAGMQMVLAMGYTVTVSAARLMMVQLYRQLFEGQSLGTAIRSARMELYNRKDRRAAYDQTIELEDWLLPVVYQNQPQHLKTRDFTPEERAAWYARLEHRYQEPAVTYGFLGRDLDILHLEKRLLTRRNLVLVRGMAGAGKSTLLHHLGAWWQTTGLVGQVFYFGYDQRAWTRQQILASLGPKLFGEQEYRSHLQPLREELQQEEIARKLRAERHLLILDNLESITGSQLAILNTLDAQEQRALHAFLGELAGGKTLVLLGSRGDESWLAPQTFENNVYELPGLDAEAASTLADRILERHKATGYRGDVNLEKLLKLLEGYPLALEVVLSNLARQTPQEVLQALESGDARIDPQQGTEDQTTLRTRSLLACIGYSHSNLSLDAQQLLLCLAPFTGMINRDWLIGPYSELLQQQPELAHLPFQRWEKVLAETVQWGLLSPDSRLPIYLRAQPIFPYFLRTRLQEQPQLAHAIETAFRLHYDGTGGALSQLIRSKDPRERQTGQVLIEIEHENLMTALRLTLVGHGDFSNILITLSSWLESKQGHPQALALYDITIVAAAKYPLERKTGNIDLILPQVSGQKGNSLLTTKQYDAARSVYNQAMNMLDRSTELPEELRTKIRAKIYHQLGMVAQEQRQWAQAEQYYQQALRIKIEFNDNFWQARTYHQLGRVAHEQRQWTQAERYYQQALQIFINFNDRYEQARTYHQLGAVAQEQRQWAQAEQYYQQALQTLIEFNDRYEQAKTYHQLGIMAQERRQWAQAEQYYQQALQILIEFNDRYKQAKTHHQLGTVAQEQRQWAQAEQYYQQALQICREFNDRYDQARTYHQLGIVAQEQRQWAQAEQHYQQALQICREFNDRYEQAGTYQQLGIMARQQRQWAQAEQYYQQALQIYRVSVHQENSTQDRLG
jgi:tetratricopeptide (TPR) repeat protein